MSQAAPGDPDHQPPDRSSGQDNAPRHPLTEDERADALQDLIRRHATQLGEHFSSVRIVATLLESDGCTRKFSLGAGDYYAQLGATRAWLNQQERDE